MTTTALKMTPVEALAYVEAFALSLADDGDDVAIMLGLAECGAHEVV